MAGAESDTNTGEGNTEQKPEHRNRILLCRGEQTLELEGLDDLVTMSRLAGKLWRMISPDKAPTLGQSFRFGFAAGGTLHTERAPAWETTDQCVHPGKPGR